MMIKKSNGERIFGVINVIIIGLISIIMLAPYLNVLAKAFNDGMDASRGGIYFWPRVFTLDNFKVIFSGQTFTTSLIVTVSRVIIGVVLAITVQFSAAYSLSKKYFPGKGFFSVLFMIPTFITAGQMPTYILYSNMGLLNNFWVYILPGLFSFYNVVIIKTFIQSTIPVSLEEAALIDGASEVVVFAKIIIPLCKPILATIALWVMVAHWNDWTTTLLYIRDSKLYTLQYVMMEMVKESERTQKLIAAALETGQVIENTKAPTSDAMISAQVIATTIPIICVYPFLQKYFVKGVMVGSVKG